MWVGNPITHLFLKSHSVGCCFPGRLVRGPAWGQPILPCLTVRAWRPPPLPDKGFGFRARSVSSPLSAALGSGPFLCLPSGSVSSRDPLFDLEVLLCRVQACLLTPAIQGRLPTFQAWLRKLLVGGCPPARGYIPVWSHGPCPLAGIAGVFSGGLDPWKAQKCELVKGKTGLIGLYLVGSGIFTQFDPAFSALGAGPLPALALWWASLAQGAQTLPLMPESDVSGSLDCWLCVTR